MMTRKSFQSCTALTTILAAAATTMSGCALEAGASSAAAPEAVDQVPQAVESTTSAVGGNGGNPFSITCPDQMVLIGIRVRAGSYVDRIQGVCSRYDAGGRRIGSTSSTSSAGNDGTWAPAYESICPGDQALAKIGGRADLYVDSIATYCSDVLDGKRSAGGPDLAGSLIGGTGGSAYDLTCPDRQLARGFKGRANDFVDRISVVCDQTPVVATHIRRIDFNGLSPSGALVSGTPILGRVVLNGYTLAQKTVAMSIAGADGSVVPNQIFVAAGATGANFTVSSTNQAVGCAAVTASLNGTPYESGFFYFNPPSPDPSFRFTIDSPLIINFSSGPDGIGHVSGSPLGSVVDLHSSNPSVASVPTSIVLLGKGVGKGVPIQPTEVPINGGQSGCAVITATKNGVSIRRPVYVVPMSG